jgi:hypothetical protein
MADVPQIVLTHADAATLNIFTNDAEITWLFPGKEVVPRTKATGTAAAMNDGYTVDPNNGYRVVTCSSYLTGDEVSTLNGKLLPNAVPTYDATDPKIVIKLDGDTSLTILCAITACKAKHITDARWLVSFIFTERTT